MSDTRARPSWTEVWMRAAEVIGERSRCDMRQIGAVIVSDDNAYSVVGYNGPPAGYPIGQWSTCKTWCPRAQTEDQTLGYDNCISIHAEANALMKADHSRIQHGTLYVNSASCWGCGKLIANSGVRRVVMNVAEADAHRDPERTIKFLRDSGIHVEVYSDSAR